MFLGLVVMLCAAMPLRAQWEAGNFSTSLQGYVSAGYSGTSGNLGGFSTHGWELGGSVTANGYYYSPSFVSYAGSFYLNQSKANSDFKSVSNTSGFNLDGILFTGSHFPGGIGYSQTYDSEGSYNVPGLTNYVTHGNGNSFQIQWGETLPHYPTFSASYIRNNSNYSVYGANESGNSHTNLLNLRSSYTIDRFQMGAYYSETTGNSSIPALVTTSAVAVNSSGNSEGFNLSHSLPLNGSMGFGVTRSTWNDSVSGINTNGTVNQITASATIHPTGRVAVSSNLNYTDNLNGEVTQAIISAGGLPTNSNSNMASNSFDSMTTLNYSPDRYLQTNVYYEHEIQNYQGVNYSASSYGAGAAYSRNIPSGSVNASFTLIGNFGGANTPDYLGMVANGNYVGNIKRWRINTQFSYSQNVQTLLVTYTNSYYNFSGNVQRSWGRVNMAIGGSGAYTGLTQVAGISSTSQSYNASLGYSIYLTATGNYTKSSGTALLTANGLGGLPPTGVPSALTSLYGGDSYSVSLGSSPVRNLVISGTFNRSISNMSSNALVSNNVNGLYTAQMQYQLRKLYFTTGYERLLQGFSGSGMPPQVVYSYYAGISRWFKFF